MIHAAGHVLFSPAVLHLVGQLYAWGTHFPFIHCRALVH